MIFHIPGRKRLQKNDDAIHDDAILTEFRRTGNPEILGELYSAYMHLVYGVCLKYLKNRDDSMDAVIQIFEKLMEEVPRHDIKNFRSWLHVVTKNYCLMQLRSERSVREKAAEWQDDMTIFMENEPVLHPLDEEDADGGNEKMLNECIEKLKSEQKECIRQFYYNDKCYREIADNLGMDEKKVKSYLQNAKRNLKLCMEGKNEEK